MNKLYRLLLLVLVLGLFNQVQSQNESFLGLSLGIAMPQGVYAEKDFYSEGAGYASNGFLFTFDGTVFPDDYLGISATVSYGSNNPDKTKYQEDLINDFYEKNPELSNLEDNISFDYGTWRYLNFHAGPAVTFRAGPVNFDLRVLGGLSLVWSPELDFQITEDQTLEDPETLFSRKSSDKAVTALGFTAGAGVRYKMKNGYVLRLIAEYSNSKPTFTTSQRIFNSDTKEFDVVESEVDMPIKNIHLGIGIAYNFEL